MAGQLPPRTIALSPYTGERLVAIRAQLSERLKRPVTWNEVLEQLIGFWDET